MYDPLILYSMLCKIALSLVALVGFSTMAAQNCPEVIAHRGYWKSAGSAQNSISSLQAAAEIGAYGSEFDVVVSSDGVPVVNHDRHIGGLDIEATPYRELKDIKLSNGEKLPTLKHYIRCGLKHKGTKLILELKPHSSPQADVAAAGIVVDMVKKLGARDMVEYITFSLTAGREIIRLDPDAEVAYLNGDIAPTELKKMGFSGLDYHIDVLRKHENWFEEARQNDITVNVWTVNAEEQMRYFISKGVDFITTDEPERLQKLLSER